MMGPKEKKERALGEHLLVKGERCASPKCAVVRRPYRPGVHGKKRQRGNMSEFGRQIREKQKFKITYGLDERGLQKLFTMADRKQGSTIEEIVVLLERRLDNALFRLGFSSSRSQARQFVVHGHIFVNGKKVLSPGLLVREGDVISIRPLSESNKEMQAIKERIKNREMPLWLLVDTQKVEGKVVSLPRDIHVPFETSLLVESFSK